MLSLMMTYEIYDISFFLKSLTSPSPAFNILDYVQFNPSPTRTHDHKLRTGPGIQEQINLVTFTSLVFPDCGMLYLPPTFCLCLMSKLLHPSLLSFSTIFKITSTHHSPAHFTTNVPVAPFTLNLTYSVDYHYLSINFIH